MSVGVDCGLERFWSLGQVLSAWVLLGVLLKKDEGTWIKFLAWMPSASLPTIWIGSTWFDTCASAGSHWRMVAPAIFGDMSHRAEQGMGGVLRIKHDQNSGSG